jgi:GT2 family glycosyltransferase
MSPSSAPLPVVSIALFAYNQERHIRAAVEGALAQDYDGPLQIILSDDGSTDATFAVMEQAVAGYTGPHQVLLNRNDPNLGLSAHVNHVMSMAQGEIIVMAAGDDICLPARVRDTVAAFARQPDAMAVSFVDITMDELGQDIHVPPQSRLGAERPTPVTLQEFLAAGPRAQSRLRLSGASRAFRREVWETFGPLQPDCPAEDTPLLRRALYLGTCLRCEWPGIRYRLHAGQMSSRASIAQMKAALFQDQYQRDLTVIEASGGLDTATLRTIRQHIAAERVDFLLRLHSHAGTPPDWALVRAMLPAQGFAWREKLGLLKRFLLRKSVT